MKTRATSIVAALLSLSLPATGLASDHCVRYEGKTGPGKGKHIVLVSGDEEYRSEEALPQLGKILAVHHGFDCTVLFAIDEKTGTIDPNNNKHIPGLEALDSADLLILFTRFRDLPDAQMKHIDAYLKSGKPVLGMRTSTHAFNTANPAWAHYGNGYAGDKKEWNDGFGRLVLGERWVSHHGDHKKQSTRGILVPQDKGHPILRGLKDGDVWGDTDVYGVRLPLPGDSKPLVLGQILSGMKPTDAPISGPKNNPMMPVAWTKTYQLPGGKPGRVFNTTMGAATDLVPDGTRRLLVNAVYWCLGIESQIPPAGTKVDLVGEFHPTPYGFNGFKKGVKPADHALAESEPPASAGGGPQLNLQAGEHISIIGNTLAERMQHDGWLETRIQQRFPKLDLSFRNLSFSADELTVRLRSEGFGTPDEWLARTKADVVFAFFGFNESFAGQAGLEAFKTNLAEFIRHTRSQKYNGKSAPRLVLFSPIAHEDLQTPNLPDGSENNRRIELYTTAMAEVAKANGVLFVDLFHPSRRLYEESEPALTINGIHLTQLGNREIANVIDAALFGVAKEADAKQVERLRQAVVDKNFYWFHRYRTTDGYSSYGGRSYLKFVNDQTNREVMFRELEVLDGMTANRDKRIWAVANGGDLKVDDSNTPPFIPVITNKPGAGPNGAHLFLSGEEEISKMTIGKGLKVGLYASEETFPELINPVQMAWDTKGRLWVAAWPSYPHWKPKDQMDDKLLILEDTNGDGKADRCKTFAGGLHNPTGFEFWGGGVLVSMAPDLVFLKDSDGDDVADVRERVLHGLDSADTHHTANSFVLAQDGALYFQEGVFHRTQVETPYGPVRNTDACVWRFEPRTWKLDRYVAYGFANPHGHSFDAWGQDIVHDGTGANPYHGTLFSGHVEYPRKHDRAPQVYNQRTRPCPGTEFLYSRHFPDDFQGNLLVGNVIGFQGILRYRIDDDRSSFAGTELEPILSSSDPNFRPADFETGPDGAFYFTDWHNPIIGHMQHNLRDPSRDRIHGRVYRVTCEGRPLLKPAKVAGTSTKDLLELLREPESRTRYRARIELSGRPSSEVLAAVKAWVAGLDAKDAQYEHLLTEALWLHQQHNVVDAELLHRVLAANDFRARSAGTHVLSYWRDRVPDTLYLLRSLAGDKHPRVRLEAVRAASFLTAPEAIEVPLIAAAQPTDPYLDYTLTETRKTLEPIWKRAVSEGHEVAVTTESGERFFLRQVTLDQVLARKRTRPVLLELLDRSHVRDEFRLEAVAGLAKAENKSELEILLQVIQAIDGRPQVEDESLVVDLMRLLANRPAAQLTQARSQLQQLAVSARQPVIRQIAFAAMINVDRSPDKTWDLAAKSVKSLRDLLAAVPFITDSSLRAQMYPKVLPLLNELPPGLAATAPTTPKPEKAKKQSKRTTEVVGEPIGLGRYVRIELPRRGTLTLAEVEVFSGGQNIARKGKASQINTASGGAASRAIDGDPRGLFGLGGQTHTEENTPNPWWEVDLGEEMAIEAIAVHNRTEGDLGKRLDGFTLRVLDGARTEVFRRDGIPAPARSVRFELEMGGLASAIRRSAMTALVSIRGKEPEVFAALAPFVRDNVDRLPAVRAMQRIPKRFWVKEEADPLLSVLVEQLKITPVQERTSQASLDVMEFADALASLAPVERGKQIRQQLRELGVRVVRVGTLPERMAYDKDTIAVAAGKPVEFFFENTDLMPHNFVITQPGALEQVGLLAESSAQQPGALERHYVPQSDRLLLASKLLQSRQSQRLSFQAPKEPGVYPYVCTYPGHWRRMYGALYVVEDLDQYLANPESYLTSHPLEIKDELLKERRPRTEWKFEDLASALERLKEGRSFGDGKQMFTVASCVACHKLGGVGTEFGPDLAKLDPKFKPEDVLREMFEPSARINEKFFQYAFEMESGDIITGLVVSESADEVKVIQNPLAKADPVALKKKEIVQRTQSKTSLMPKGLLDKLTLEEILDLVAYVSARGDAHHEYFHAGGHHNHK